MENNTEPHDAQKRFDELYITSTEICTMLDVSRYQIHMRRVTGKLPNAIKMKGAAPMVWERETIMPYIHTWGMELNKRRSVQNVLQGENAA